MVDIPNTIVGRAIWTRIGKVWRPGRTHNGPWMVTIASTEDRGPSWTSCTDAGLENVAQVVSARDILMIITGLLL